MTTDLRTALKAELDAIAPSPGDLDRARREGDRLRSRRRARSVLGGVAAAAVLAVGATQLVGATGLLGPSTDDVVEDFAGLGELDFSGGLRAYADPGGEIHLGGRTFDGSRLEYLDTDAAATPYGVIFFDRGRPMLLDESGESTPLVEGAVDADPEFHPTAKADSARPLVAWATRRDDTATITVRDMESGQDVATTELGCGECHDLVIDAVDGGVVFVRTADGTSTWKVGESELHRFAGPDTRVADVRNGVVLYDGPAPDPSADGGLTWRLVPGPIDAQLTFDGAHVLAWSSRLEPTTPGGRPLRLEAGPVKGLGFWTVDTDGSVLVAALDGEYPNYLVHDCEIPSGRCAVVGPLKPTGGDPMFLGNDM
jgi:hypothetical protein